MLYRLFATTAAFLVTLSCTGCVLCIDAPITSPDELVDLPGFVGSWVAVESDGHNGPRWDVEAGENHTYKLTVTEPKGAVAHFEGRVTKIGKHTVLVIKPEATDNDSTTLALHAVALSGVYPITKSDDGWIVTPLDYGTIIRLAEEDDNVEVREVPLLTPNEIRVLIAKPAALRTFLDVNIDKAQQGETRYRFKAN